MKKVTMKDIATRLGVSITTVSLVFNNKDIINRISEDVSSRVRKAIIELNYQSPASHERPARIKRKLASKQFLADGVSVSAVATEASVSITTVSFVLNGKAKEKRISDKLCKKIWEAIEMLNKKALRSSNIDGF